MQQLTRHTSQDQTPQTTPSALGSFRCNRRGCKTCRFIKEGTTSYTFFATNEQKSIRRHITCSCSNLVYMIQCTKCKIQYIGETKSCLSDRFGEHRRAVEKAIVQRDIDQPTEILANKSVPCRSTSLAFCLVYLHSTVTSGTCISTKRDPTRRSTELLSMRCVVPFFPVPAC